MNIGIASYNIHAHVPSDVPTHNQIIPKENLKSQEFLSKINNWTDKQKMKLNEKKTKNMIFNFSKKNQFTAKLSVNDTNLEVVEETKLLGTILTNNLSWDRNTEELVKRAFRRMNLLFKAANFTNSKEDLKAIYLTYIRSVVEQSSVVWHSSLSKRNRSDLERVQKAAVKVIMGKNYTTYKNALNFLRIDNLNKRREKLCLSFAKKCLKNEKVKDLFPLHKSKHQMKKRKVKKFQTKTSYTKRYQKSALPYMRKLLNDDYEEKCSIFAK